MFSAFFTLSGRLSRRAAWLALLPLQVAAVGGATSVALGPAPAMALYAPLGAFAAWATVVAAVKRRRDAGQSAWPLLWVTLAGATGACAMLMETGALAAWGGIFVAAGAGVVGFWMIYVAPGTPAAPGELVGDPAGERPDVAAPRWAALGAGPTPARAHERRCKPVPQSFKGVDAHAFAQPEPVQQPGGRASFGLRGP